jgi:hypothetical protein
MAEDLEDFDRYWTRIHGIKPLSKELYAIALDAVMGSSVLVEFDIPSTMIYPQPR